MYLKMEVQKVTICYVLRLISIPIPKIYVSEYFIKLNRLNQIPLKLILGGMGDVGLFTHRPDSLYEVYTCKYVTKYC